MIDGFGKELYSFCLDVGQSVYQKDEMFKVSFGLKIAPDFSRGFTIYKFLF